MNDEYEDYIEAPKNLRLVENDFVDFPIAELVFTSEKALPDDAVYTKKRNIADKRTS